MSSKDGARVSLDDRLNIAWDKFRNSEGELVSDDRDLLSEAYNEFLELHSGGRHSLGENSVALALAKLEYHINGDLTAAEMWAKQVFEDEGSAVDMHESAFLLAGMYLTSDKFKEAKKYAKLAQRSLESAQLSEERYVEREITLRRIIRHSAREQGGILGFVNKSWYGVNGDILGFDVPRSQGIRGHFIDLFAEDVHQAFPYLMSQDDFDFWCDRAIQDELGVPLIDLCKDVINYVHGLTVFERGTDIIYLRDDLSSIIQDIEGVLLDVGHSKSGEEKAYTDMLFKKSLVFLGESYMIDLARETRGGGWSRSHISELVSNVSGLSQSELHERYIQLYGGGVGGKHAREGGEGEIKKIVLKQSQTPLRNEMLRLTNLVENYRVINPDEYDFDDKKRTFLQLMLNPEEGIMWRGTAQEVYDTLTYGIPVFGSIKLAGKAYRGVMDELKQNPITPQFRMGAVGCGCVTVIAISAGAFILSNWPIVLGGVLGWVGYKGLEGAVSDPIEKLEGAEKGEAILNKMVYSYPQGLITRPVKVFTSYHALKK